MDFYILLGVEREASDHEIKRAYRRLARRFHPDINPGDREAAARFRQILDAYETLIDPDRRRLYDTGGGLPIGEEASTFGFAGFDFSAATTGDRAPTFGELFEEVFRRRERHTEPDRGADVHAKASLTFEDAWRGVGWDTTITRLTTCHVCAGSGFHRAIESRCRSCEGSGSVRSVRGHMVFSKNCRHCDGTGRLRQLVCDTCQGQGVERRVESVNVQIPPGIPDGARLRVSGRGHAGLRGGAPGDLLIDVEVHPHQMFRRQGDDLHVEVPLAIHEAALGARIALPTPDGPTTIRIPPGTQSGQQFRFRERGAPSAHNGTRGDLVVQVRLMLPKLLDERSKELLREFGRINGDSVREWHG
jgi:molecular chaperone DnaJ